MGGQKADLCRKTCGSGALSHLLLRLSIDVHSSVLFHEKFFSLNEIIKTVRILCKEAASVVSATLGCIGTES